MVMLKINIHEAKTHLSQYLLKLEAGETILLCKRNVPIAEIRPLTKKAPRKIGLAKRLGDVPETFFEPLPEEIVRSFESPQ
jgi:antitoxin (DNA-binding transcriptional repressor) of toxin-antitoxin stability system